MEVYEIFCGEPWFHLPKEVSEMTDFQLHHLLYEPAIRRAREQRRLDPSYRNRVGVPNRKTSLPSREDYVKIGLTLAGVQESPTIRERLERKYDEWAASEDGKRALTREERRRR